MVFRLSLAMTCGRNGLQTLNKAMDFIGRVDKVDAEVMSMKRVLQQTLIDYTKPTLIKEGIREYNISHPELSDSEERER